MAVKHILVIDDDDNTRLTVGMLLRDAGYEVTTTSCTERARGLLGEVQTDLIICDLYLISEASMETSITVGLEFVSMLATRYPQIPVLAMSGFLPHNALQMMRKFGARGVLEKPFGQEQLVSAIRQLSAT